MRSSANGTDTVFAWLREEWIKAWNQSESVQANSSTALSHTIATGGDWREFAYVTIDMIDNFLIR